MAWSEGALRKMEGDIEGGGVDDFNGTRGCRGAVARTGAERAGPWAGSVDGSDGSDTAARGIEERGVWLFEGDDELFGGGTFIDDDVGDFINRGGDAEAPPLAERIEMEAAVGAEDFAGGIDDLAWVIRDEGAEEIRHFHLADETNALAVLLGGVGEVIFRGEGADCGLEKVADGEVGVAGLVLLEESEEIRLVLVGIGTAEDVRGAIRKALRLRVVAGGDGFEAIFQAVVEKDAEFDFAVAHDIGIWGDAILISGEEVFDDAGAVVAHEVDDAELNAEAVGDGAGVLDVLLPRAVAEDVFLIDPVLHVSAHDLMALLQQEGGGGAAVNAAGHG